MRPFLVGVVVLLLVVLGLMVNGTATTAVLTTHASLPLSSRASSAVVRSSSVVSPPTLSVAFIERVLHTYRSPAVGKGQSLYDLGVQTGIDPAVALAFFQEESVFGTLGEARSSLSLGNIRCLPHVKCQDGFAWFPNWEEGFRAWYTLIATLYVKTWHLITIQQIIPRYAPSSENNVSAYIAVVTHDLDTWHQGEVRV